MDGGGNGGCPPVGLGVEGAGSQECEGVGSLLGGWAQGTRQTGRPPLKRVGGPAPPPPGMVTREL